MENKNKLTGWTIIGGAIGFLLIVIFLHIVQQNYDPINQLMSELALGRHGSFMFLAFFNFALSVFAAQIGLHRCQTPVALKLLLLITAISLLGAGVFRLGNSTELHIALVAIAFVLIVLVMYLLPKNVAAFKSPSQTLISWTLGAGTATFVALSQNMIPAGIGQRGATLCILTWLVWLGFSLIRKSEL